MDGAGKIAGTGEITRSAQQHGGVAVMAAGMHLAGELRFIGPVGNFRHGQRIHVGAKTDAAGAVAHLQSTDHAGAAQAAMHLHSRPFEKIGDDGAGSLLFKAQFRMSVEIVAKLRQEWQVLTDAVQQSHG